MSYNPYGGLGSIVITPRKPLATERRLGTRGARLTDTTHGKAIRRSRNGAVTSNKRVERILPALDEATQERLARGLTTTDQGASINLNIHDK
jgi:hypothetical protein